MIEFGIENLKPIIFAVYWIVLGAIIAIVLVKLYDIVIFKHIDLQESVQKRNTSAILFFGLMLIGITSVIGASIASPSRSSNIVLETASTIGWAIGVSLVGIIIYYLFDKILMSQINLEKEVSQGNLAAGLFSGIVYIAISLIGVAVILS
ncbi:MAG TPA: DUF350 domain-containing protein [Methanosarcinales archaeon]|nr:DUF350 domain-containing protein [Methanosarcinales archaeon]